MTDRQHMARALALAEQGRGLASPGALVGAVLVRDGEIVGEGRYTWDGVRHAEIQALEAAGARARGATLYISLEPCAHHGRTPPCAEALVAAGIRRVVAAMEDPFPAVRGRGFDFLRRAGVAVDCGLLAAEARQQNEAFLHSTRSDRPFGILKVAMSLDGKIATAAGESRWITSPESRARVHELRHAADALLTGSGTVLADDPLLTDRSGRPRRRPLLRAVVDRRGRLRPNLRIFSEPGVLVYTGPGGASLPAGHEAAAGVTKIEDIARDLGRRQVQTLLIECGPDLAFAAIRSRIVDKIVAFVAPRIIGGREIPAFGGEGAPTLADAVAIESWSCESVGPDLMITGYVHRNR